MLGKNPRMNSLESRKRLLRARGELNRDQLVGDMAAPTTDVRALTGRAKSIGLFASSVTALAAGLAEFRRGKPADAAMKASWLQTILKGAGLVSNFWLAFRSQPRDRATGTKLASNLRFGL